MIFSSKFTALLACASLSACGSAAPWPPWGPGKHPAAAASPAPPAAQPSPPGLLPPPPPGPAAPDLAPLETFLVDGTVLPERLKAASLVVRFRSNAADAAFDCRPDNAPDFSACAGDAYDFGKLVHGRGYALAVRARTPDGRVGAVPLTLAFVADLLAGTAPTLPGASGAGTHVPTTAAELVSPADNLLQIGAAALVRVPVGAVVTGYSTSKTYNSLIHSLRLLGVTYTSVYPGVPCTLGFERLVTVPDGRQYCDATPTDAQWATAYGVPMPKNYAELVLLSTGPAGAEVANEKLFVAAFDSEPDSTEGQLGTAAVCAGSPTQGSTLISAVAVPNGSVPQRAELIWCLVRDQQGASWWVGTLTAAFGPEPLAPRLRVTYTANAVLGLFTGEAFATRVSGQLPVHLQALAQGLGSG